MFVVGWDTYTRLVDPKYYPAGLEGALQSFKDYNVSFIVGCRNGGGLVTPPHNELFKFLSADEFYCDLSST